MNTSVKTLNSVALAPNVFNWSLYSVKHIVMLVLVFAVLISAFSLVYVKDMNRRLLSNVQTFQNTQADLHTQWSKLLLEESALSSNARIERIATQQLGMVLPKAQSIVVVNNT